MAGEAQAAQAALHAIAQVFNAIQAKKAGKLAQHQYELAAQTLQSEAAYNAQLLRINLNRNLDDLSRQIGHTLATQRAQISASGVTLDSQSSLAVMNSTMSQYERQILRTRNSAHNQIAGLMFEAKAKANAAINNGRIARYAAGTKAAAILQQGASDAATLINQQSSTPPQKLGQ